MPTRSFMLRDAVAWLLCTLDFRAKWEPPSVSRRVSQEIRLWPATFSKKHSSPQLHFTFLSFLPCPLKQAANTHEKEWNSLENIGLWALRSCASHGGRVYMFLLGVEFAPLTEISILVVHYTFSARTFLLPNGQKSILGWILNIEICQMSPFFAQPMSRNERSQLDNQTQRSEQIVTWPVWSLQTCSIQNFTDTHPRQKLPFDCLSIIQCVKQQLAELFAHVCSIMIVYTPSLIYVGDEHLSQLWNCHMNFTYLTGV